MGSIFYIKNQWNILVIGNYYVNYQNFKDLMLLTSSDTKRTLMHLFLFPPRENWFQYVRRVYAIAINFPRITTLISTILLRNWGIYLVKSGIFPHTAKSGFDQCKLVKGTVSVIISDPPGKDGNSRFTIVP